jgi:hypothetical protein
MELIHLSITVSVCNILPLSLHNCRCTVEIHFTETQCGGWTGLILHWLRTTATACEDGNEKLALETLHFVYGLTG